MRKMILVFIFFYFTGVTIFAQGGGSVAIPDPVSTSMGKTYTISSKGVYALGKNPANLMMSENGHVEVTTFLPLPALSIRAGFDFMTINEYNYFFGGSGEYDSEGDELGLFLSADDKQRLKDLFDGGGKVVGDFSLPLLAFTFKVNDVVGAFGFSMFDIVSSRISIPQAIVDLALDGNEIGKEYNFDDMGGNSWWIRKYSLHYSRSLNDLVRVKTVENISVGISFNYVQGMYFAGIEEMDTRVTTNSDGSISGNARYRMISSFSPDFGVNYDFDSLANSETNMGPFPSPAGNGFSVDIGTALKFDDVWTIGLAITDIGAIRWEHNVAQYTADTDFLIDDITESDYLDSLAENMEPEGSYMDKYSTQLPTALRLGVGFQIDQLVENFPGQMMLSLDYNQGLNNVPGNNTTPRFSLGMNWKPGDWIPFVRTGFSFGGSDIFGWGFGLGFFLGPIQFNLATSDLHNLTFNTGNAERLSFSLGTRWVF